jgi:hypothetical protein
LVRVILRPLLFAKEKAPLHPAEKAGCKGAELLHDLWYYTEKGS